MHWKTLSALALASLFLIPHAPAQPFANAVVHYSPGSGAVPDYQDPASALGAPSTQVPGFPSGTEPVTPFNPPFLGSQLVSIGAGGSLTVSFAEPVRNSPSNPFGLDFLIFGNNGFVITNGDFGGGGVTDGSLFKSSAESASRVFVSADNVAYFELVAPSGLSASVNGLYPTEGVGNPQRPVDPTLTEVQFGGRDLAGIRALYQGSAGGTGFDLAWARTVDGQPVNLAEIRYARIDVTAGRLEVDSFTMVPEPATWAQLSLGVVVAALVHRRNTRDSNRTSGRSGPLP